MKKAAKDLETFMIALAAVFYYNGQYLAGFLLWALSVIPYLYYKDNL